ncbi:MAG TPA: hypothetical protein VK909_06200 [Anaerolineales bacterium]|nr:hypothetical protein [Anaerolineales bacterium]
MSKHNMIRWSGIFLILAGVCIALGTIIHPSKETPQVILAQETRLITGHWLLTFYCAFLMLGLPGAYAFQSEQLGRLGLAGFLFVFFGTLFYAVSSDYGFNAPVLARLAPETLDAINAYPSVVVMDGLFVLLLFPGFILFGIAIQRSHVFPPWSGILIAAGWSLFMICAPLALFVFEPLWILAVLGTVMLGFGLAWVGYVLLSGKVMAGDFGA